MLLLGEKTILLDSVDFSDFHPPPLDLNSKTRATEIRQTSRNPTAMSEPSETELIQLRAELLSSIQQLSSRCLYQSSKW